MTNLINLLNLHSMIKTSEDHSTWRKQTIVSPKALWWHREKLSKDFSDALESNKFKSKPPNEPEKKFV